jgi:quinol monooxygenase YgiN
MKKLILALVLGMNVFLSAAHADDTNTISPTAPSNPDFVILSFVQIKDNRTVDFKKAILPYAALTRKEAGNLGYVIHQSAEDYHKFVIYEHWRSAEDRVQHLAAPYTVQFFNYAKTELLQDGFPLRMNYQLIDSL